MLLILLFWYAMSAVYYFWLELYYAIEICLLFLISSLILMFLFVAISPFFKRNTSSYFIDIRKYMHLEYMIRSTWYDPSPYMYC